MSATKNIKIFRTGFKQDTAVNSCSLREMADKYNYDEVERGMRNETEGNSQQSAALETNARGVQKEISNGKKPFWSNKNEVYIKGIPMCAAMDDVKDFFRDCGEVKHFKQQIDENNRATRGVFVRFGSGAAGKNALDKALLLDRAIWTGGGGDGVHFVRVEEKIAKKVKTKSAIKVNPTEVLISNMPADIEDEKVAELFVSCGPIKKIRIKRCADTMKCKGFGHIEFQTENGRIAALRFNKKLNVGGKIIKVALPSKSGNKPISKITDKKSSHSRSIKKTNIIRSAKKNRDTKANIQT